MTDIWKNNACQTTLAKVVAIAYSLAMDLHAFLQCAHQRDTLPAVVICSK